MTHYTGESVAEFITTAGAPCQFVKLTIAPQLITYHFKLNHLQDHKNIKNIINLLNLETHQQATTGASDCAHFSVIMPRAEREVVETVRQGAAMKNAPKYSILFGINTNNEPIISQLERLPHLLIAGTTGSGKSCALASYIIELCAYNRPQDLGVVLIDLKRHEFQKFKDLPHLMADVITDALTAEATLYAIWREMEERYKEIENGTNTNPRPLVVVVDELADLVLQNPNTKKILIQLLQKSRAANIHFILATQSPRASVLDGLLLANIPTRLALTCANARESVLILGHKGAEQLTGAGDAIIKLNGDPIAHRLQVPYINAEQINKIINRA